MKNIAAKILIAIAALGFIHFLSLSAYHNSVNFIDWSLWSQSIFCFCAGAASLIFFAVLIAALAEIDIDKVTKNI